MRTAAYFPRGPLVVSSIVCEPVTRAAPSEQLDTGYADPHADATSNYAPRMRTPRSARNQDAVRRGDPHDLQALKDQLSPHASDDELVLVCVDCGREIEGCLDGECCLVTGRRHT